MEDNKNKVVQQPETPKTENSQAQPSPVEQNPQVQPVGSQPATEPSENSFMQRIWKPLLWPVVTLLSICLIVSFLLGITNQATQPQIEQNTKLAADQVRKDLLPQADGFEELEVLPGHDEVTAIYHATNDSGYVIEAFGRGYGGRVPVMVAFDTKGVILGVAFPANDETPGLGQKLVTEKDFGEQFTGLPNIAVHPSSITGIASATVSSNAAISGVNAAIGLYNEQVMGIDPENLTPDQVLAMLLPDAGTLTEIKVDLPDILEAYQGGDGNFIIFAEKPGAREMPVTAAVSMSPEGVLLGLWLDTSNESEGYGTMISSDQQYVDSFAGQQAPVKVDVVAGSTITCDAVTAAVDAALEALPQVKEAA